RFVPVSDRNLAFAETVCARFSREGIRADIDDREESVNKKIREAGMDWVPYVAVVGDREAETATLTVTIRSLSEPKKPHRETLSPGDLAARIAEETGGMPFRPLYTPRKISKKPRFI
ncbi:MAG: threonine--tRNA ligase, partial [Methanomicrobiales archaeon]|nr:threonine--tRNA ligase [Methanomicrobiales archaeon]